MTDKPGAVELARDIQTNVGLALQDNPSQDALLALQRDSQYLNGHPQMQYGKPTLIDNEDYSNAVSAELHRLEATGLLPKISIGMDGGILSTKELPGTHLQTPIAAQMASAAGLDAAPVHVNNSRTIFSEPFAATRVIDSSR